MKRYTLILTLISFLSFADAGQFKIIDDGGNGAFKSIALSDPAFENYVVYRPQNIKAAVKKEGPLPVVIFANGGCNDTSFPFEHMLSEIASHGYIVIALGAMQTSLDDRILNKSPNIMMTKAVDLLTKQTKDKTSDYFQSANMKHIAFAGQSCGGAQVLALAAEPRIKTYMMFNSGMGDMTMANASRKSLSVIHAPIIYLVGGESDIATANALLDYDRIDNTSVAFANHLSAGNSGTFEEPYGGSFSRMALKWLDWQLKQKLVNKRVFLNKELDDFPEWTMKSKHF